MFLKADYIFVKRKKPKALKGGSTEASKWVERLLLKCMQSLNLIFYLRIHMHFYHRQHYKESAGCSSENRVQQFAYQY